MTDKIVIVCCGIPGAGKSTWFNDKLKNGDWGPFSPLAVRINMDEIRIDVTGSDEDQSKNHIVARLAESKLKWNLDNGAPIIVWDNTSITPKYRKVVIELAKKANYRVLCVFFNTPLDVCLSRNKNRSRVVPEDVIRNMHNNITLNPPTKEEGFDDIIVVNP